MHVRLFSDIGQVMTKIDWEGICTSSQRKLKRACTVHCWALKIWWRRKGKTCDRGTSCRYLIRTENAIFILFCLRKWIISHNVGTAVVTEKQFYFSTFYHFFFIVWIPNVNWFLGQVILQLIKVIAPDNDLLMSELNVNYFPSKWWLYVMIWLPRTTDNSTYFAQFLEIRGIESRL